MAALESALRLETDLRVHGDAVIGARLNLLIKAAPDVGAGLAEPEPVRGKYAGKLPARMPEPEESHGSGDAEDAGYNEALADVAKVMREQGIEVEDRA